MFHLNIRSYWRLLITAVVLSLAIIYVFSLHSLNVFEKQMASEIQRSATLQEEQKKLKAELSEKRSPDRVASIAREKLQMSYPERRQVIFIKGQEEPGNNAM